MKILYGVPGEGMGHATRSKVILSHLLQNHDVRIVSSSRAYTLLHDTFGSRVHQIKGFNFVYNQGGVSKIRTLTSIIKHSSSDLYKNFKKYIRLHQVFKPDLVISDFESFSYYFARFHKIPIISIDNMQVIDRCRLEFKIPTSEKQNYYIAKNIVKAKVPGCNRFLVSSFFNVSIRKKNTTLIPPILRNEIIQQKPTRKNHILVYQTTSGKNDLVKILNGVTGEKFFVYGFNREESHGNVILKKFSEKGFISHLAGCKAVITNGGYSLISEAVYFNKPVLSVPLKNQFEQYVNGAYIEKEGYGRFFRKFSADRIKAFLYDVSKFSKNLQNYRQSGNIQTLKALDQALEQVAPNGLEK